MRRICFLTCAMLLLSTAAMAASALGGAVVIRVPDGQSERCINIQSDKVYAIVRRFVATKKRDWFSENADIGIVVGTTLEGETSGSTERITFQRSYLTNVRRYEGKDGLISIPIEPKVLTGFHLRRDDSTYESAEISFQITNTSKKTTLSLVVESLAKITDSLPLPANPYTDGFKYFASYSNDLIDSIIKNDEAGDNISAEGGFTLNFSTSGICRGDLETTGTIAIVYGLDGTVSNGVVDIHEINELCWTAELRPSFVLKFAEKGPDGSCPSGGGQVVRNPYIALYLNAVPTALELGGEDTRALLRASNAQEIPDSAGSRSSDGVILSPALLDAAVALDRCEAHGISFDQCF